MTMNFRQKIETLDIVTKNGIALRDFSSSFKNDRDIVLAAVKNTGIALQFASEELQNNFDVVLAAVSQDGYAISYASYDLKNNRQILLACCDTRSHIINLSELTNELKSDEEFILAALEGNSKNWQHVSEQLRGSPTFILKALEAKGHRTDAQSHWNIIIEHVSSDLRNNRDFYLLIVKNNCKFLRYMSDLRKDRDFILDVVKFNGNAIKYASPDLQNDPIILMEAVFKGGFRLANAPFRILNNVINFDRAFFNQIGQTTLSRFRNSAFKKRFLEKLNGSNNGEFKKFIEQNKNPRIAWYPSAGKDFRPLLFLQENYLTLNPPLGFEPALPDIFIFTDQYPLSNNLEEPNHLFLDRRTTVTIEHMECLPNLGRSRHNESIHSQYRGNANDSVVFLIIKLESDILGTIIYPVLYVCTLNERFCCNLLQQRVSISHIILVRYGGTGSWLSHVLKPLNCELFISDMSHEWHADIELAKEVCPNIPDNCNAVLTPIRVTPGEQWSNHGDVFWHLVN